MQLNRRSFLRRSGWGLASGAVVAPALVRAADQVTFKSGDKPRHIIHLVADGMSPALLAGGEHFSQFSRQRELTWLRLCNQPGAANGLMNTRSLNSLVTDSAAAASAWGSGSRVVNGALNVLPDGRNLRTLCELFGEADWKRGLVTTTEITHATPAGFAVSVPNRGTADDIAAQYLEERIEVLLGGGSVFFEAARRKDHRNLRQEFADAGYVVMSQRSALEGAPVEVRWLGIFERSHLPFTVDRMHSERLQATVPTLAEMSTAALRKLERESHFLLQVEGGRVDHAAHLNDAAGAVRDLIAFDEAVEVCVAFRRRHPDTLIVVTTDHGTGNPGLNGTGRDYNQTVPLLHNLARVKRSYAEILQEIKGLAEFDGEAYKKDGQTTAPPTNVQQVREIIRAATDFEPSERRVARLCEFFTNKGDALYDLMNNGTAQLGQLMGNHLGFGWTSLNHTSDFVPLVAVGPGAEQFNGFLQNVDVFRHYTQLAGIDYQNPALPLMAECAPSAAAVEEQTAWV